MALADLQAKKAVDPPGEWPQRKGASGPSPAAAGEGANTQPVACNLGVIDAPIATPGVKTPEVPEAIGDGASLQGDPKPTAGEVKNDHGAEIAASVFRELPPKQDLGKQDEPAVLQQGAEVDKAGVDGAASPLAGGTAPPHASKTPSTPAGQPTAVVAPPTWREVKADPPPPEGEEEWPVGMVSPDGLAGPASAKHSATPAEQARSSAVVLKKTGRWWLGMALVAGTITAGGYAYLSQRPSQGNCNIVEL